MKTQPGSSALEFTGERFVPECVREIWYEHWHRYAFATSFAADKRVLDAACGEGYGSALLAPAAASVIGLDISEQAITHARSRYAAHGNLRFERMDATALNLPDASIDLVTSFETLEHVAAQQELVAGFARVLTDDGLLLISSPDKSTYSENSGFRNEFHVRELYREELLQLLRRYFPYVQLYGQKLLFQSALWSLDGADGAAQVVTCRDKCGAISTQPEYAPLYYVAVCGKQPISQTRLPAISLFGDSDESVYKHYNEEIRKGIGAGHRILELESQLANVQRERDALLLQSKQAPADSHSVKENKSWWRHFFGRS